MAQITYTNKVALNENQEVADINKVNASDMNEIKSVVNGLVSDSYSTDTETAYSCNYVNGAIGFTYSTSEVDTGKKWIDGRTIYRKSYTGTAVKSGSKTIDTISAISNIISYTGTAESNYDWAWSIPNYSSGYEVGFRMTTNTKQLQLTFGTNYNTSNYFVLTIEYTKSS